MYLFEATSTQEYYDVASLSAQFIKSQLYNGTIIYGAIRLSNCLAITNAITYNSGLFIEGLSVFANYTQSGEWTTL